MHQEVPTRQTRLLILATIVVLSATNVTLYAVHSTLLQLTTAFVAGLVLLGIMQRAQLSLHEIGLSKKTAIHGAKYGAIGALAIITVELIAFLIVPTLFKDQRYDQSYTLAFRAVFILVPLRTILLEEFAFRGALLSLCLRVFSTKQAVILSSLLFGIWHILPSLTIASFTLPIVEVVAHKAVGIVAIVLATTCAGIFFSWLRLKTRSLAAPMLVHWAINSTGIILAAIIWHR